MSKVNRFLLVLYTALILCVLASILIVSGCAANPQLRPTDASQMIYGSLKGAHGHMSSGIYDAQQAKKLVGKGEAIPFIDANIFECEAAQGEILVGMTSLDKANDEARAAHFRAEMLERDIRTMKESDRWKYGGWVVWGKRIFFLWALSCAALTIAGYFLTGPAGVIVGGIGRVLWFPGWIQWAVDRRRITTALYAQPPQT